MKSVCCEARQKYFLLLLLTVPGAVVFAQASLRTLLVDVDHRKTVSLNGAGIT